MKAPKKSDKKIGSNNPAKKMAKPGFKAPDANPKKRFDDDEDEDFDYNDLDNFDSFDEYIDDDDDY